jgi:hypothetical protein
MRAIWLTSWPGCAELRAAPSLTQTRILLRRYPHKNIFRRVCKRAAVVPRRLDMNWLF